MLATFAIAPTVGNFSNFLWPAVNSFASSGSHIGTSIIPSTTTMGAASAWFFWRYIAIHIPQEGLLSQGSLWVHPRRFLLFPQERISERIVKQIVTIHFRFRNLHIHNYCRDVHRYHNEANTRQKRRRATWRTIFDSTCKPTADPTLARSGSNAQGTARCSASKSGLEGAGLRETMSTGAIKTANMRVSDTRMALATPSDSTSTGPTA